MLKLVFAIVNIYDKLFITDRIVDTNAPSLTKWANERYNFRHELVRNIKIFTTRHVLSTKEKKKKFTNTIFFKLYTKLQINFFLLIFLSKCFNSRIDSWIIYFSSSFSLLPPLIVLDKDLANLNITTSVP